MEILLIALGAVFLVILYAYTLYVFSAGFFLLNLVIALVLWYFISKDLKRHHNHKYYIGSLLVTAIFFILSITNIGAFVLLWAQKLYISPLTLAIFCVYGFAQVIGLVYEMFFSHKRGHSGHRGHH